MYKIKKSFKNKYSESCEKIVSPLNKDEYLLSEKKSLYERFSDFFYNVLFEKAEMNTIKYGKIENVETILSPDKTIVTIFEIGKQKYITDSVMCDKKADDIVEFYTNNKQESDFGFAYRAIILNKKSARKVVRKKVINKLASYFFDGLAFFTFYLMFKIFQTHGFAFLSFFYCWLMTSFTVMAEAVAELFRNRARAYDFDEKDKLRIKQYKNKSHTESFLNINEINRVIQPVKEKHKVS